MIILLADGTTAIVNNKSIYYKGINKTVSVNSSKTKLDINTVNKIYSILKGK